ncbi:MAG: hypothetical protein A2668_00480 [Candidatus Doudnabacteria bacterium RIFCSPHIGHO2_01_FULL_48_180]|uniref:Lipoprotein n=1 Tax=Candidatus Giovannonibacteria bacterium GW2011_GWA2_45_21 TaxID=1618649 RepID=A0A0G1Q7Z7_9BACT|nr:MAG: Lipoprotein [Candidatus Giovannonibacteria bacterium GW2011_GWA2_45_21]OGE77493.1 MAG: hypothetical protein A2668_00480 [Candidatus Doudnabacteria bacterium RIFCSPHIGHO2_01_FULL_48_180]
MKTLKTLVFLAVAMALLPGCFYTALGGGTGALIGGGIGGTRGALLGGGLGTLAGAAVDHHLGGSDAFRLPRDRIIVGGSRRLIYDISCSSLPSDVERDRCERAAQRSAEREQEREIRERLRRAERLGEELGRSRY